MTEREAVSDEQIRGHVALLLHRGKLLHWEGCRICNAIWPRPYAEIAELILSSRPADMTDDPHDVFPSAPYRRQFDDPQGAA